MSEIRDKLFAALQKPLPEDQMDSADEGFFNPWDDVVQGIHGCYSSESDELMIAALKAARDRTTFDLIRERGFAAEFALYVLSGHGLLEYGTSPRGGWPDHDINDLWQSLIDKWEGYAAVVWPE